ncbi:toprim domain-containing protein [Neobacillus rhizosphaerae]|uniref:toprim domain-containing protein n=1 Tax=Neobacillus rhizosphaerae TaxID=2880965 RepID=UPI003D2DE115
MLLIGNYEVEVDFESELRQFDWAKPRWKDNKLIACSPFRDEFHPSFAVTYDKGGIFIDSGGEGEWRSGNFVKLLSWLRNETVEETQEYLLEKYFIVGFRDINELELSFEGWETKKKSNEVIPLSVLDQFKFTHPYLEQKRGIEEIFQRALKIGYDPHKKAVSFPIFDKNGTLINIKFRSVKDKIFWYHNNNPVREHLYLLDLVMKKKAKRVFLVESEIDAITLFKNGFPAIAVMGGSLTKKQKRLLLDSGIETLVLATDNDKQGRRLKNSIHGQLGGLMNIEEMSFPEHYKDVNDIPTDELIEYATNTVELTFSLED